MFWENQIMENHLRADLVSLIVWVQLDPEKVVNTIKKRIPEIGKKLALNKYDQFTLIASCFWGKYQIKYYPQ